MWIGPLREGCIKISWTIKEFTSHFDGGPPIRIPYIFMFFCNFVRLHKRKFSSNSKILFSLVCFCIDKRHAAYKKHMILVLSHNKGKLNRILELLENLLLCNRISNKNPPKKHGILTGGPSKCDVNTLTVQLFFVQPSRSGPVHMK